MTSSRPSRLAPIALLAALAVADAANAQTKLLRFPDIHGDRVVFTYGGDLWLAPASGGTAWRLTAHPGEELFPKFSPDGRWIAFTGQYDGDEQVYVVPTAGGTPRQLTWYPARGPLPARWGYDNQVYDWTPDGESVLFRSMRYGHELADTRLFLVSVDGGLPEPLPMPEAGGADLSPDASKVVYSPLVRDFRAWKRYQGGWAQELWVFDLESHALERVTDNPRADRDPMWIGDTIYFSSDRDGKNNLYAWDAASKATTQITHEDVWDVRWPADDGEARIVYELAGELEVLDLASGAATPISIRVPDDGLWKRPSRVSAEELVEDFELSPGGERALFVARGDVFTVPVEHGPTRNLTASSGAHDKWARWSPDGSTIAYMSDASGEDEIWLAAQDGSALPRRLTHDGAVLRYAPQWSPDGSRLAFGDKNGKIFVVDVESGDTTEVADEARGEVHDYEWSPDGSYLAFSLSDENEYGAIWIWSAADGVLHRVTDSSAYDFGPAWGADGAYLYYFSDRAYAPQISAIEWNFATDRETYLYALALREDVADPFPPQSDEVALGEGAEEDAEEEGEEASSLPEVRIDFEGLADRVARVPVEADNYGGLSTTEGRLLYVKSGPFYYGRESDIQPSLWSYSLADREETMVAEGIDGYALSGDGTKVLVRLAAGGYQLLDSDPSQGSEPKPVATAGLQVDRVPEQEWRQIFGEVWRRYRDFFYVENMHGYDWQALRERYEPLLDHVAHRSDLNYVLGEMIAELSTGHTYIAGGDWQAPARPSVALPGAVFELDEEAGRYRIASILPGINEEDRFRSPLTEIGVDVSPGDYVLAIDGEDLVGSDNPYRLLRYKADRPVTFTVSATPSSDGARTVTFEPVASETELRYLAMVEANKQRVEEMTDGRVGYIYIPDMGAEGIQEFIRQYYPQIRKQGLVVDVRSNGGGNVSQMLIERLRRRPLGTRFSRNYDTPSTYPDAAFYGPMVCLLDEDSGSDGDIFPYYFREAGLGPLIGKRSWGGVVGITDHGPLIDGGTVYVPQFGTNALDGSWIIEGHGVEPDIVVENDATSLLEGRDPQLERGVAEVLKAMEADPKVLPERPAPPVKTE